MTPQMAEQTPPEAFASAERTQSLTPVRLTPQVKDAILDRVEEGKSYLAIAKEFGVHDTTVGRLAKKYHPRTKLARRKLAARADVAADKVVELMGCGKPEVELKAATKVLEANQIGLSNQQVSVFNKVEIANPLDSRTWGPGPSFIEAKAVEGVVGEGE